jgi:parallel beta-helix repeat protein
MRFEGAASESSSISNSVIYNGLHQGIRLTSSKKITLRNNVVFNQTQVGINLDSVSDITIDGNIVAHIGEGHSAN